MRWLCLFLLFTLESEANEKYSCLSFYNSLIPTQQIVQQMNRHYIESIRNAQNTFDRPHDFIAATRVSIDLAESIGTKSLFLMRTYDSGLPGVTFPVPLTGISMPQSGTLTKYLQTAYRAIAYEYLAGHHKYKNNRAKKVSDELASYADDVENYFDERSYFYMIKNPIKKGNLDSDQFSSFLMLKDGSTHGGKFELTRMESVLKDSFNVPLSELRPNDETGIVELFHGFNHSNPELKDLNHFIFLLREAGTYIDMQFLQQKRPVQIRVLASPSRARLYERFYGFKTKRVFKTDNESNLIWLETSGLEFVNRFGSRWPEWQDRLDLKLAPPRYLGNSYILRNEILVYLHSQKKIYDSILDRLLKGHTVSQGWSEPPLEDVSQLGSFWDFVSDKMVFRERYSGKNGIILF
jgi:hypothetical protein